MSTFVTINQHTASFPMVAAGWHVLVELAPWLLFGTAIAGLLHVLLPAGFIRRTMRGPWGVFQAVAMGLPLPLCSCAVIPAGIGLKRDGASNGASLGFLISTPQTGVDSLMVSAGMLGWPFALFKLLAAAVTGVVGGLLAEAATKESPAAPSPESASRQTARSGFSAAAAHGLDIIRSVWVWLFIGIAVSAAIEVLVPSSWVERVADQGSVLSSLFALLISLPLYVCAVSSVPVAGALVAKGLPVGAALVFLMAGPATNVATIGAIYRCLGKKMTVIYLGTVISGSVLFAFSFDLLFSAPAIVDAAVEHSHAGWWREGCAVMLLGLFAWFACADLVDIWRRWVSRGDSAGEGYLIEVKGMTCDHCASRLAKELRSTPGVRSVDVTLASEQAEVRGAIGPEQLRSRIEEIGFQPGAPQTLNSSS